MNSNDPLSALLKGMADAASKGKGGGINTAGCPKVFSFNNTQYILLTQTDEGWIVMPRAQAGDPVMDLKFIPLLSLAEEFPTGEVITSGFAWDEEINATIIAAAAAKHPEATLPTNENGEFPYPTVTAPFTVKKMRKMRAEAKEHMDRKARGEEDDED